MGRRGPAPTPTKLKILRGNPGKRKLNDREPQPATGEPSMPTWLPAEARAEWRRVVPELQAIGLLSVVDRAMLATYCLAWARMVSAAKILETTGDLVDEPIFNRSGKKIGSRTKPHAAVKLHRDASAQTRNFQAEFGLSPASRARIQVPKDATEKDDPLLELIRRESQPGRPA